MPINYKNYPKNWKTEIRPAILKRANNCCEFCKAKNNELYIRGVHDGCECYQDMDGSIFASTDGMRIGEDYVGEVANYTTKDTSVTIVLTIAHLDHDVNNSDSENLKALCQKCHLNYDKEIHAKKRAETLKNKKGIIDLFKN